MAAFRMICIDIDGTLLDSKHRIGELTKQAIQEVNAKHISVVLVSARMPQGTVFLQQELGIEQPFICYNGALLCGKTTKSLESHTMNISDAVFIHKIANRMGLHISFYRENNWYIENKDSWIETESAITGCVPIISHYNSLLASWERMNTGPHKIMCINTPDKIQKLQEQLKTTTGDSLSIFASKSTYLEIIAGGITKKSGIEILAKKKGITSAEILAIGDNYNDIDMIEYAGLGIAMGNAPEEVKRHADCIVASNDNEGVAEALRTYVL